MIIELPIMPSDRVAKRYRMAFFHFSNNNLSIRTECAREIGRYDPEMRTSEDVEICFRVALSKDWVACREPGVVVRHRARRTLPAMVKQLWGWGINLGKAYRKTRIRGLYLYWVSATEHSIQWDVEFPRFPILVTGFITQFHVAHLFAAGAVITSLVGGPVPLAGAFGLAAVAAIFRAMHTVAGRGLGFWKTLRLAGVAYIANVSFMTAAFVGGLRAGIIYIPAAMFPPAAPSERLYYEDHRAA